MNIYIGNLPYTVNESKIRELFETYGDVDSVNLITDRETGKIKGFGFIEINDDGGQAAIEGLNETEYEGRTIVVNQARQKKERRG